MLDRLIALLSLEPQHTQQTNILFTFHNNLDLSRGIYVILSHTNINNNSNNNIKLNEKIFICIIILILPNIIITNKNNTNE